MEPLLVIGASGLLGQYVVAAAQGRYRVMSTYRGNAPANPRGEWKRLDITNSQEVGNLIKAIRPTGIVLTAALTGVDYCEDHPEEAEAVNAEGPRNVAEAAQEVGARLVHVSTDYVFDGQRGGYGEDDAPSPLGSYGRSKLEGERAVLGANPGACIVRVCAVYGWNRFTTKTNFATWIIREVEAGRTIDLWKDQYITPTYAGHAAPLLLRLLEGGARGIYHVASPDCVNRWEFGLGLCKVFGFPPDRIRATSFADAQLRAPRPMNSCLRVTRVEKQLNIHIPSTAEATRDLRRER